MLHTGILRKSSVLPKALAFFLAGVFIFYAFAAVLHHHEDLVEHDDSCFICHLVHVSFTPATFPQLALVILLVVLAIILSRLRIPSSNSFAVIFSRAPPFLS